MSTPTTANSITERVTFTGIAIPEVARQEHAKVAAVVENHPSGAQDESRREPKRS